MKEWAAFSRFLQLAATESGQIVNDSKLAEESGISHPTVKSHYELLEDMFIGFRIPAFSRSSRKGVLERHGVYAPIEVKWTENPSARDARHLVKFLKEHGDKAPHGYIICRRAYPMQIHPKITALP